ncbi:MULTISPECIES: flagellar biosynthesis protein FlhB [Cohnella]|uniref:flagellar biosynthesis protein FlhB n=1 Tax=Cohnella TaxID=329857 RepID=UPI0009BC728E|nr:MULTISPECIES: flagellar biosynthesis protein FlhB [Cohnella]MBN2983613.1 flagellar biosynthesis protein FlhB [Cohnella algarum]
MARFHLSMDLQLFSGEKTEKATPKKRNDARKKGQVAHSQEMVSSVELLVAVALFLALGNYFWDRIIGMFSDVFMHRLTTDISELNVYQLFASYTFQMLMFLAPIFIGALVVVFAVSYMQFGWLFTTEPLKFKFSPLNPIQGFKRMFSARSLFELVKSSLKLFVVAVVVIIILWAERDSVLALSHVPLQDIYSFAADLTIWMGLIVAVLLFVLAIGDFYFQKYQFEKSIRMSKQDIKDEYKNMEGDPKVKARIRERQRRMAIMRMMQEVPKADVIITNPTHFAVALQYDGTKMDAPRVVAKGQDYLALRIREIAKANDVITMENKPLARALFERTEIGETIPGDLFQAVAEVLAYVYRLKGRRNA